MYPVYHYIGTRKVCREEHIAFPAQHQPVQPGLENEMEPRPIAENPYEESGKGKLCGRCAIITGGDSGIGRAVAYAFAKEGADLVIAYLNEHCDADETKQRIEQLGRGCVLHHGDIGRPETAAAIAARAMEAFGRIDILVNNAAMQVVRDSILQITPEQLEETFRTNVFGCFYMIQAALSFMKRGACIINTASITAYRGHARLLDYSATKGAVVSLTRALALSLAEQGIRVNGVAPGPVWTLLQPASFPAEDIPTFGTDTLLGRAAQPYEMAGAYVYLASDDASYMTGQLLHPNGGAVGLS